MQIENLHNPPTTVDDKKPSEKEIDIEIMKWARFLYSAYKKQKIRSRKNENEV